MCLHRTKTVRTITRISSATVENTVSQPRHESLRDNKVVSINTTSKLAVVLVKPDRFEQAAEIADHLKDKRTVVLNLEQTNKDIARRLVDFSERCCICE